jgi:hypothetical protein
MSAKEQQWIDYNKVVSSHENFVSNFDFDLNVIIWKWSMFFILLNHKACHWQLFMSNKRLRHEIIAKRFFILFKLRQKSM